MPRKILPAAFCASIVALALAAPAQAFDLFGPSCLEKLSDRTRLWAECNQQFSRGDERCKLPKSRMHNSMQKCASEGKTKAQVDAAMARGYRSAGRTTPKPPKAPAST